jgi:D-beta-D-heptose 7-phosphate kinase / D-beta-D-heptose 1-phosphate adenosyltransferase
MTHANPAIPQSTKEASLDELVAISKHYRRRGKTIAWTNGCFEILHAGHIDFFLKAARLADIFIVGVNSDASVAKVKGEGHPFTQESERLLVLSAVECIDHITVFDQPDCTELLRALQPDVYAKGLHHLHGGLDEGERMVIEESGGCIALIAGDVTKSTSALIERIRRG